MQLNCASFKKSLNSFLFVLVKRAFAWFERLCVVVFVQLKLAWLLFKFAAFLGAQARCCCSLRPLNAKIQPIWKSPIRWLLC